MLVKPAPGLKVRHPVTMAFLPDNEGTEVSDTDFHWNRLLRDGDVVLLTPETRASTKTSPATAAKAAEDRSAE